MPDCAAHNSVKQTAAAIRLTPASSIEIKTAATFPPASQLSLRVRDGNVLGIPLATHKKESVSRAPHSAATLLIPF
jgi:hypothetical protein